jgi:hypothetical protein
LSRGSYLYQRLGDIMSGCLVIIPARKPPAPCCLNDEYLSGDDITPTLFPGCVIFEDVNQWKFAVAHWLYRSVHL